MRNKIFTAALCVIAALCLWASAFNAGIHHAIYDGECYIVDFEDPDAPEGDTILYIDLDNETYIHWLYIG